MVSPQPSVRLRALVLACAASLTAVLSIGCGSEDDSATGSLDDGAARGGGTASPTGGGGVGGGVGGARGGASGGAGRAGFDAGPEDTPGGDATSGKGGKSGAKGADPTKTVGPPDQVGGDAGFCNPTLVVTLPVHADGMPDHVVKMQVHADTTSDLLGAATNRYEAVCGESAGEDLLIGLDVPESGNLTLSLAAASKGFQGVLSVERGVCKGTLGAAEGCAIAEPGGVAQLSLVVTKGEHLFVFVDSPAGRGGEFNLVATLVPAP